MDGMRIEQINNILRMAILYLKEENFREVAKVIIRKYYANSPDSDFPITMIFNDQRVDWRKDTEFIQQIIMLNPNSRILHAFIQSLEKNAYSLKEFGNIIIDLCSSILSKDSDDLNKHWGLAGELSKLIISLFDECYNAKDPQYKEYSQKCLDLWDIMFEKQIGFTREISEQLLER